MCWVVGVGGVGANMKMPAKQGRTRGGGGRRGAVHRIAAMQGPGAGTGHLTSPGSARPYWPINMPPPPPSTHPTATTHTGGAAVPKDLVARMPGGCLSAAAAALLGSGAADMQPAPPPDGQGICKLPLDVAEELCKHLTHVELAAMACTCRFWRAVVAGPGVWAGQIMASFADDEHPQGRFRVCGWGDFGGGRGTTRAAATRFHSLVLLRVGQWISQQHPSCQTALPPTSRTGTVGGQALQGATISHSTVQCCFPPNHHPPKR